MRQLTWPAALALACLAVPAPAEEKKAKPPDPALLRLRAQVNPEYRPWAPAYVVERCAEHLATVNKYDRVRIRYLDLSGVPRQLLPAASAALLFGTAQAAMVPRVYVPRPVPDTDNRLFWIDLAWFNWTPEVWEAIAGEDPYFREPIIPSDSKGLQFLKNETYANAVLRGDWLVYYAYDNSEFLTLGQTFNEKSFYYRLLYANTAFERDVKEVVEREVREPYAAYETRKEKVEEPAPAAPASVQPVYYTQGGVPVYAPVQQPVPVPAPAQRTVERQVEVTKYRVRKVKEERVVHKKVKGVGPATAAEFQQAWHVDFNLLKDFPVDQGAMIGRGKSGVSYENRIIWRVRTGVGVYWRTFDVARSVGDQDFVETPFPMRFDAGEHIVIDNRGAQFYHLSNGKDQSVDFGDPRVVRDHVSGARVLVTASSCIYCHDTGVLAFRNENRRLAEIGAMLRAYDYNRAERFSQFYLQDKRMQELVLQDQADHARFIRDVNGLTPQENSTQFARFRAWYARDVDLNQAAREIGCAPQELADALGNLGTKGRLGALALDNTPIPRQTWERSSYAEAALLLIEWRRSGKMKHKDY